MAASCVTLIFWSCICALLACPVLAFLRCLTWQNVVAFVVGAVSGTFAAVHYNGLILSSRWAHSVPSPLVLTWLMQTLFLGPIGGGLLAVWALQAVARILRRAWAPFTAPRPPAPQASPSSSMTSRFQFFSIGVAICYVVSLMLKGMRPSPGLIWAWLVVGPAGFMCLVGMLYESQKRNPS